MEEDHRPWGYFGVLGEGPDHKIKKIVIYPGQRLSLQRHRHRSEHWFFVLGDGSVTKGDQTITVQAGSSLDIPQGTWHRVSNPGETITVFIEVQTGEYFGEDDIERAEDDYGRLEPYSDRTTR